MLKFLELILIIFPLHLYLHSHFIEKQFTQKKKKKTEEEEKDHFY
jgi:hypothetical protein